MHPIGNGGFAARVSDENLRDDVISVDAGGDHLANNIGLCAPRDQVVRMKESKGTRSLQFIADLLQPGHVPTLDMVPVVAEGVVFWMDPADPTLVDLAGYWSSKRSAVFMNVHMSRLAHGTVLARSGRGPL